MQKARKFKSSGCWEVFYFNLFFKVSTPKRQFKKKFEREAYLIIWKIRYNNYSELFKILMSKTLKIIEYFNILNNMNKWLFLLRSSISPEIAFQKDKDWSLHFKLCMLTQNPEWNTISDFQKFSLSCSRDIDPRIMTYTVNIGFRA